VMSSMVKLSQEIKEGQIVGIFADDGRKFKTLYSHLNLFSEKQMKELIAESKHLPSLAFEI
jgi:cysteine synthase B